MNKIENIIVHCSASTWGCVNEIRKWHLARGWDDIGYPIVILNSNPTKGLILHSVNGSIEFGRPMDIAGAHCIGYNQKSIGICLIGDKQFSILQIKSLLWLLQELIKEYDLTPAAVLGHYETESGKSKGKTCPNIDMDTIRKTLWEQGGCGPAPG
jgi:hypothetical protein